MTLMEVILKALGQAAGEVRDLKVILSMVVAKYPDAGAVLNPIIAALDSPIAPENLAALGSVIPGELLNIAMGRVDGRPHAGDAV